MRFAIARGLTARIQAGRLCRPTRATVDVDTAVIPSVGAIRNLNLHEFQSMELMNKHGILTPRGYLASDPDEAEQLFSQHFVRDNSSGADPGFHPAYLKAQVLSGGRNRAVFDNGFEGGVHPLSSPEQAYDVAAWMLGRRLLARDAPEGGLPCHKVFLAETHRLRRRLYVSILMDRNRQGPILVGSALYGSRSITDIARFRPDAVFTEEIDALDGLEQDQADRMAENLGLEPGTRAFDQTVAILTNLYALFVERDCTMVEIYPLGDTLGGDMVAVGTRVQIDDNAAFRQADLFFERDWSQMDPREAWARKDGIDYVGLEGSIGCMVNGAGLAMATMDLIHSKGGSVANFLDVGGGADQYQVQTALSILEADPRVNVILVNVFGGLMRCDVIANGILEVSREIGLRKPIILRLQGSNYEGARALLAEHQHREVGDIRLVDDLDEAAVVAVTTATRIDGGISYLQDDDPLAISGLVGNTSIANELAEEMAVVAGATDMTPLAPHTERAIPRFEGFSL